MLKAQEFQPDIIPIPVYGHEEIAKGFIPVVRKTSTEKEKGVVNIESGAFFRTVPLNEIRAELVILSFYGRLGPSTQFFPGQRILIPADVLQKLPGWDSKNLAYLTQFHGMVSCTVVIRDENYGYHITVEQN